MESKGPFSELVWKIVIGVIMTSHFLGPDAVGGDSC